MQLELLNPWWNGKNIINSDKHIKEYESKEYQWKPDLLSEIELSINNVYTLRGPRQIGKTTLVKLLIRNLIENRVDGKSIFFWNCDELIDFKELLNLIREYLDLTKRFSFNKRYIFLDEISRIKDWQIAIKSLRDSGILDNCCLFLTGSNTLDIKYGVERLPGRTGKKGRDFLLLPMTFHEFVKLIKPEIKLSKIKGNLNIINKIKKIKIYDNELRVLFNQYLIAGGFPLVINEFFSNNRIPNYVYEIYLRWIIGDIVKWGKQEKILIQVIKSVISKQASAISWDSLSKEAEVKSHKTISAYVEDLQNMFVLNILYFLELSKKVPNYSKNKKIYFFDPFIYHVFNNLIFFKENEVTPVLVEAAAISNLARLTYQGLTPSIYYWSKKKEVDVVLKLKDEIFPFEIKYQKTINKSDFKGLYYFNKGILVTKDFFLEGKKYSAVPIHLLLALI